MHSKLPKSLMCPDLRAQIMDVHAQAVYRVSPPGMTQNLQGALETI